MIKDMVRETEKTANIVKDVDLFMKRILEVQMISQLVMNESIKDLKSVNLQG